MHLLMGMGVVARVPYGRSKRRLLLFVGNDRGWERRCVKQATAAGMTRSCAG